MLTAVRCQLVATERFPRRNSTESCGFNPCPAYETHSVRLLGDARSSSGRWHPRLAGLAVDVSQADPGGRDVHRAEDDGQVKPARADRAGIEDGEITIASDEGDV